MQTGLAGVVSAIGGIELPEGAMGTVGLTVAFGCSVDSRGDGVGRHVPHTAFECRGRCRR